MQMSINEVFICRRLHMNTSMILICIWLICRLGTTLHTKCCGAVFSRISVIGQQFHHPLHLQAVNRRLFNQLLTNKLLCETSATNSTSLCDAALTLSNEEENAIRYACGYVCMKVLKTLRSSKKANAIQFAECLSNMACDGDESSYYKYTLHWTGIVNRGGLFVVGEYPFLLFKAVEVQTKLFLPAYLGKSLQSADIKQLLIEFLLTKM